MRAEFGAPYNPDDVGNPELLRQVTGIAPEAEGMHVLLERAGFMSVQRLGILKVNGGIRVALSPGEYQSHARYLYSDRRAETFVSNAREGAWSVDPKPHIAFYQAPPYQRLYLDSTMDCDQYVKLWQGPGLKRIHGYGQQELTDFLWPWLKEKELATPEDDKVFHEFWRLLGDRRVAHLRPALRAELDWTRDEVATFSAAQLADEVRAEVNRVLQAIGEPRLPVG
jgi:hypothetical protein